MLGGYLIAYLNLDEVIRIIREEDEPKPVMMARFTLTDEQAEAILNMRLRALRKLEEIEIRNEHDGADDEKAQLEALLASDAQAVEDDRLADRASCARSSARTPPLGKRRTTFADAPEHRRRRHPAGHDREASRSPSSSRRRAGSARMKGHLDRSRRADLQGRRPAEARLPRADHRQAAGASPPAASSSRSAATSCRAGAAMASRCASWSTWKTTRTSSPSSSTRPAASCWSPRTTATASSCRRTRWSPTRARASRC